MTQVEGIDERGGRYGEGEETRSLSSGPLGHRERLTPEGREGKVSLLEDA